VDELKRQLSVAAATEHLKSIRMRGAAKLVIAALKTDRQLVRAQNTIGLHNTDSNGHELPPGFELREEGLYSFDRDGQRHWLCSKLEVIGKTRDRVNGDWGRWVRFADDDGIVKIERVGMDELYGDVSALFKRLASQGLQISKHRFAHEKFAIYLTLAGTQKRVRTTKRVGWYDDCISG
jgi:Domain of unknown function (DUF927)